MEKITLTKNGIKKEFSKAAAKIAVEAYGWTEHVALVRPPEIATRTRPPEIKPVQLIQPPETPKQVPVITQEIPKQVLQPDLIKQPEVAPIKAPVKKVVKRNPRKK